MDGVVDLHGLSQEAARRALTDFIARAHAEGARSVLVITGKGVAGDGVLRRCAPEWLAEGSLGFDRGRRGCGPPPPRRQARFMWR